MKGCHLSKLVLQRVWVLVALFTVLRTSVAVNTPTPEQLHALTDFADANGNGQLVKGGLLQNWNISWDAQGKNWTGGNPCNRFKGIVCWSTGNLMRLRLSQSGLQGPISPALENLTTLITLYLDENELSGDIGPVLANLTWMKKLKLGRNNFTGNLSSWVQSMHGLEELSLARNSFVGNVPAGIFAGFINLTTLDMSNNSLSGPIPDDLVSLPFLRNLSMGGNNFTGKLPNSLSNSTLNTVDLSHNLLNGWLPTVWAMPNLTSLDLSGNSLSGPLPPQLLNLTSVKLNLSQNKFVGNVSAVHSTIFGCDAFAGNPGLVMLDPTCNPPAPSPLSDSPVLSSPRKKGLSMHTIVALTLADIAFVVISLVGCVLFFLWWKKHKDSVKVGTSWPDITKEDDTSKDVKTSSAGSLETGPGQTILVKSSLAAKPDVKPALKSVVGRIAVPAYNSMTREENLDQSFSSIEQSFSVNDFGAKIMILDTTLLLEFDDLLSAKAVVLGAGSVGVVYMACLEDGQMLAIKRIEELTLVDQRAFGKQCGKLAEVLHPNLLQLRAYCWSQEKLLIFDYVKNGSVHSLLHEVEGSSPNSEKAVDWTTRLKIAVGTARAVAHLHDSDMVHGNIKASNVLLDEQFEPRVSDFGLETLLQTALRQKRITNDGYLAPEFSSSGTRRRTQEGDVYSLGVLLFELLTGKEPKGNFNRGLPGWVQDMTLEKRTMELFDPNLVSMLNFPSAQDILEFLGLAQACVSHDAIARPSITIVLRTLESIVPGSTAPRSYVKDDNFDSDASYASYASYRETPTHLFSPGYNFIPVKDDTRDDEDEDEF